MAYSEDYRRRAIEYMEEGNTYKELYEAFKIYPSTMEDWRKLQKETGALKPQYKERRKGKIDLKKLEKAIEEKPDAYLSELAKMFDCTAPAIYYALKKIKVTYKKNNTHT